MARDPDRFPLSKHATGHFFKKFRGRNYYFGKDKDEALRRFVAEWPAIQAGRGRAAVPSGTTLLTVADLANTFLHAKRQRVESGELAAESWANYFRMAKQVVSILGRDRSVADLGPADFGKVRAEAAKTRGPNTLTLFLALARSMFRYGAEILDKPPRFGDQFAPPTRKVKRVHRAGRGARLLDAPTLRRLIAAADPITKAQILLGLNCGFGATDCSELTRSSLTERPGWVVLARRKTGVPRACPLWTETQEAVRLALDARPAPLNPTDADRIFLSPRGHQAVRFRDGQGTRPGAGADAVARAWRGLCRREGVKSPGGFYLLRHVHRTVSDSARDKRAADAIMGHVSTDMASSYVESIADERLEAVINHVKEWLWPKKRRA